MRYLCEHCRNEIKWFVSTPQDQTLKSNCCGKTILVSEEPPVSATSADIKTVVVPTTIEQHLLQVMEWIKEVKDFSLAQVPDIARQLIKSAMIADIMILSCCVPTAVISGGITIYLIVQGGSYAPCAFIPGIICGAAKIASVVAIYDLLKIKYVPKLFVLETMRGLIGGD